MDMQMIEFVAVFAVGLTIGIASRWMEMITAKLSRLEQVEKRIKKRCI